MREVTGQTQSTIGRDRFPAGGLEFFTLLARLLRRPRRGDRRLPLIWLVRTDSPDLMAPLRRFLGQGPRRRVPHAKLDAEAPPGAGGVPALLRELHRQLSLEAFGAARLRFRHYPRRLADAPEPQLRRRRRRQSRGAGAPAADRRGPRTAEALPAGGDAVSIVSQVLLWLIRRAVPGWCSGPPSPAGCP
ncbi:hypothetical protein GCM10027614_25540 [Micromonospora vulcania]